MVHLIIKIENIKKERKTMHVILQFKFEVPGRHLSEGVHSVVVMSTGISREKFGWLGGCWLETQWWMWYLRFTPPERWSFRIFISFVISH